MPARLVPAAVEECGRSGVPAAYVLTSGFEGQGEQGKGYFRELEAVARRGPVRVAELLAPVYGWFTEGFDTRDLKEAKTLLDALAS